MFPSTVFNLLPADELASIDVCLSIVAYILKPAPFPLINYLENSMNFLKLPLAIDSIEGLACPKAKAPISTEKNTVNTSPPEIS